MLAEKLKHGYSHHIFAPHLKNNGNARFDLKASKSNEMNSCPERVPELDSSIRPMESKSVHDRMISIPNDHKLQFWVIVLTGIDLFLHGDEIMYLGF